MNSKRTQLDGWHFLANWNYVQIDWVDWWFVWLSCKQQSPVLKLRARNIWARNIWMRNIWMRKGKSSWESTEGLPIRILNTDKFANANEVKQRNLWELGCEDSRRTGCVWKRRHLMCVGIITSWDSNVNQMLTNLQIWANWPVAPLSVTERCLLCVREQHPRHRV